MPATQAHAPTQRAHRYLHQLCDHLSHMSHGPMTHDPRAGHDAEAVHSGGAAQHGYNRPSGPDADHPDHGRHPRHGGPPAVRNIDRTDDHARIEFDWGRCDLTATATELVVDVYAADLNLLAQGQDLLLRRIENIGRRDELTLTWRTTEPT